MNYATLNKTILSKVMTAIGIINNPEIAPEVRQLNQEILLREVGQSVYDKVYDMNAYDFQIEGTKGAGMDDRFFGMAKVASASISTGRSDLEGSVKTYLDNVAGQAQMHAVRNARETGNRPRVIRISDGETCAWCDKMAGTYTNPSGEVFRRHRGCDCIIRTEGYRTRNGLLKNYTKDSKAAQAAVAAPTQPKAPKQIDFTTPKNAEKAFNLAKVQKMGLAERNDYVGDYLAKASPTVKEMAKDWDFTLQFQTLDHLKWEDATDPALVAKYVNAFKAGDKFPPVIALNFSGANARGMTANKFTILDGRHRIEALRQLGATGVPVLVGDLKGRFDLASLGL